MAALGPPIGPDRNKERPWVCLSDGGGVTLPSEWMEGLAECFADAFGESVCVNQPFQGGHIIRTHCGEVPWIQLEVSRRLFMSNREKNHIS